MKVKRVLVEASARETTGRNRRREKVKNRIGVLDIETDPFKFGRAPEPFACQVYGDDFSEQWWGDDCIEKMCDWLEVNPGRYYAHNGGRFDFFHMIHRADRGQHLKIINGRVARMRIGEAVCVDSWPLAPFALGRYQKMDIDYRLFEADVREKHKAKILKYLNLDCVYLFQLVTGFLDALGDHLTIGAAAFAKLKSLGFTPPRCSMNHDQLFRRFYFGGRTQAFKTGYFPSVDLDYFDINSAYPWAMLSEHPTGERYDFQTDLPGDLDDAPCFVVFKGRSRGVLPVRTDSDQLSYDDIEGWFNTTGWEVAAGLDSGDLSIDKVFGVYVPRETANFSDYVNDCYRLRMLEKQAGNQARELAFKFLLNSCYGKFATDPRRFKEFKLTDLADYPGDEWEIYSEPNQPFTVWQRPAYNTHNAFYDVATAASITGKVRAHMWRSLCVGTPYYCDTDSIIGEGYSGLPQSDKLGDWKIEAKVNRAAIAGRKMYAVRTTGNTWKTATKGVKLEPRDVVEVAKGRTVMYQQDAPTYSLTGLRFTERLIRKT